MAVRSFVYRGRKIAKGTCFVQRRGKRLVWAVVSVSREEVVFQGLRGAVGRRLSVARADVEAWMDARFLGWYDEMVMVWEQEDLRAERDRAHEEALRSISQIDAMIAEGTIYTRFLALESEIAAARREIDRLEDEASDAIQYYNGGWIG